MKRGVFLFLVVVWATVVWGQIHLTTSDEITISGRTLDSSGFYITPESVRVVTYLDGAEVFDTWFNAADGQCAAANDMLVFTDAWGDIDGAGGDGLYELMAGFFHDDGDLYNWKTLWVYVGVDMADLASILADVLNIDAWDPHLDNDSLIIDHSTLITAITASGGIIDDILDTVRLIEGDVDDILDTLQNQDDWVATAAILDDVVDSVRLIEGDVDDILDTLQNQDDWIATAAIVDDIVDTVRLIEGDVDDILDSIQVYDDANRFQADIQDVLDTLQNQDDWVATAAILDDVVDSVRLIEGDVDDILDTLKNYDDWIATAAILDDVIDTARLIEGDVDDILDTLKNQDDWVSSFDVSSDFVIIQDTMETGDSVAVMPDFWSAGDSAGYQGAAAGLTKANIADTVWSHAGRDVVIEDTLTTGDSVGVMPDFWSAADSTAFQGDVSAVADVADTVNAIIDTLQNQDDWVATAAILDDVIDSVRLIEGDVDDILDTLKSQDDWIATDAILDDVIDTLRLVEADVDNVVDTVNAIVDSLQHPGTYKADVSALATDADMTTLQTSVTNAASDIDSLSWWLGAEIGSYSYTHLNTGADTMWIVNGSDDTLSLFIFFHPGGAAGDPPDSFKVVAP